MPRTPLALLCLIAGTITACAVAPTAPAPRAAGPLAARHEATSLYPLTPGARWSYRLLQRQDDGPIREKPMHMRVVSAETRAGVTEAVIEREYESWKPPLTRALASEVRVVLSRLSDPIDGPSITILKFPLEPGATWPGRPLEGGNRETIAPQGAETVTVPAGTYRAERVDHRIRYANGEGDVLTYWYAPGVGVVKMIERSTLFQPEGAIHLEVTGELTRFTAPGSAD